MQVGADEWGGGESCAWRGAVWLCLLLVAGAAMTSAQETDVNEMDAQDVRRLMAEFREQARVQAAQAEAVIERAGIEVRRDIVYQAIDGVDPERLSLDLYLPGSAQRRAGWRAARRSPSCSLWCSSRSEEVSPWHHVRYSLLQGAFLIFYSDGRSEGLTQAIPFGERLRDAGHVATVVEAVDHDHGQVNDLLGTDGDVPTGQILDFVRRHAGASDYREAALNTELVPSPLEYSVLRPGKGVLPESADVDGAFPILLFLHGGGGDRGFLAQLRRLFEQAWRSGVLPPMLVATPSTTASSYYVDFHDGSERWTTFLAQEFPRALAERHGGDPEQVAIAGYSMGGVGALRVSFRHPEAFVAVAGMAAGVEPALEYDQLPKWYEPWKQPRLGDRFGTPVDAAFWAANNPASIAAADSGRLRDSGLAILVECGAEDQFYNHIGNEFLHRVLSDRGIPHEYRLVLGEGHVPVAPARLLAAFEFLGRAVREDGEAKAVAKAQFEALVEPMRAWGPPD